MKTDDTDDLTVLLDRGARLYAAGRTTAAASVYRRATDLAPDDPTVRFRLATALWHGEHRAEEALAELSVLALAYPGNASIHLVIAQIANALGRVQLATEAAEQALSDDPALTGAWLELVNASGADERMRLQGRLQRALAACPDDNKARRDLQIALGRLLERSGNLDSALDAFDQAHALAPRGWNSDADRRTAERLKAIFTPALMSARAGQGAGDDRMVFILGMPRSGTSLLDRMVTAHADVTSVGETTGIGDVWRALEQQIGHDREAGSFAQALDGTLLRRAALTYSEAIAPRVHEASAKRIVDKMPPNHLFAPLIALMFPRARIILMRRHPLDVGLSCYMAGFGFGFDYANDMTRMGEAYRLFADLVGRWREVMGERLFEVRYEALVARPQAEIRRVLDHCGLEFDPVCAAPAADGGLVKTASVAQARQPITTRSVGRWRTVEARLKPMIAAMGGMEWIAAQDSGSIDPQETKNPR